MSNTKKLQYPSLLPANIQMLTIGEVDPNPFSSNKKTKYISLDKPIKTRVLAACTNQFKANQTSSKKPVKQILHQRIEKKHNYTVSKNLRFGK